MATLKEIQSLVDEVERNNLPNALLPKVVFVVKVGKKNHFCEARIYFDLDNKPRIYRHTILSSCGYRFDNGRPLRWPRFTGTQEVDCGKCGNRIVDLDDINKDISEAIPYLKESI